MPTLNFSPPANYNVSGWQIGESTTLEGALTLVSSGVTVGSYPEWINQLEYSGSASSYYAVRFYTTDGYFTSWSDRMHGLYGAGLGYFVVNPSGSNTIYIVPPPTSGTASIPTWLEYNTEYTINIDVSGITGTASGLYGDNTGYMAADYEFFFTSSYCPLWSSVELVRMRVGPIADSIPDDTINRIIHRNSLMVIRKYFSGTNYYGCTTENIPEPVLRWVSCSAGMQVLNAAVAAGGTAGGNTSKRLGSLSITYDGGSNDGVSPGDIRKQLEECMIEAGQQISAESGRAVQWTVKSLDNDHITHPIRDPRWGRQPRQILDDGQTTGPWRDSAEYGQYEKVRGTDL